MKLIVGLGNPGAKYAKTRHNVGYRVIDAFKKREPEIQISETLILFKPDKLMNNSGQEVLREAAFYKISPADILVISDDLNLTLGEVRFRDKGSSGGHKGVQSIIDALGTEDFPRIRIGIGLNQNITAERYVLENFLPTEEKIISATIDKAVDEVVKWISR